MKTSLSHTPRFVLPLTVALLGLALPMACSAPDAKPNNTPVPPQGGGGGSGGAMNQSGSGGASSGSGGGDQTGMACMKTADCPAGGFFCKDMVCSCPTNKPEICTGANVGGGPNGVCTLKASDPTNCGECGTKCDDGAACVAGVCGDAPTDLATATGCGSIRLALDATNIYWTEKMSGKVMMAPLAGGAPVEVASGQLEPTQIAVDAMGVYWVNQGNATAGTSKVMKKPLPLAAGAPVELKASLTAVKILAIALNAESDGKLYYALGNDVHAISTNEAMTDDIIVGTATDYDNFPPDGMPTGEPAGIAVMGTKLFWATANRNGVEGDDTAEEDGTNAGYVELGDSQGSLLHQDIATDGTYGFWVDAASFRRATMKPLQDIVATPDFDMITAFAINASDVYFAGDMGQIYKHSLTPDPPTAPVPPKPLAREQLKTSSIVLDAAKAYWASDCVIRSGAL